MTYATAASPISDIKGFNFFSSVVAQFVDLLLYCRVFLVQAQFVRRYKTLLDKIPSAFFSVSLTAASSTSDKRSKIEPCVQKFFTKSGWHP
jgi:menaquinone-dependent protoporphyrinogen IX oxidase